MRTYAPPIESGLNKASVDRFAANIANQVGYVSGQPLEPVVQKLGGRIAVRNFWEMDSLGSGSIRINEPGDFEIYVAAHTGPVRDRFTIAHELGHYILHYLWPRSQGRVIGPTEAQRYGSGRVEWEANWFAAGFLMPAESFNSEFHNSGGNLPYLSERFGVSMEAARIRAQSLGLMAG
ncbi:ImmA/IrrE family metallo-endopeptidase [Azospirillum sp. INR13]|nr:ImmA/IrrE family metallo-endopeptidase [Azospirillum sp. INR13]